MKKWTKRAPFFILFAIAGAFAMGALVMVLWNATIPAVFHTGSITLLQAAGIFVLARLLFGGFRRGSHGGHHCRHRGGKSSKWLEARREEAAAEASNVRQYVANWQVRYNAESAL